MILWELLGILIDFVTLRTKKNKLVYPHTITEEQFFNFVKKSDDEILTPKLATQNYVRIFKEHGQERFFWSWNWCACLFFVPWLAYRKMYGRIFQFFILFIASVMLIGVLVPKRFLDSSLIPLFVPLFIVIFLIIPGALGNWLYTRHALRCIINDKWNKAGVSKIALGFIIALMFGGKFFKSGAVLINDLIICIDSL